MIDYGRQLLLAMGSCIFLAHPVIAADASFVALGHLPDDSISVPEAISGDGSAAIGMSGGGVVPTTGFRWTQSGGMHAIQNANMPAGFVVHPTGISVDGSVISGVVVTNFGDEGFVWTPTRWLATPFLPGASSTTPMAITRDGSAIVGLSGHQAFRWNLTGEIEKLANAPGAVLDICAISDNAQSIVGTAHLDWQQGFLWANGELIWLGDLPGGAYESHAEDVSADGQIVVGFSTTDSGLEAFKWTRQTGMVKLGVAGSEFNTAKGISADGSTIVGGVPAYWWRVDTGRLGLKDMLYHRFGIDLLSWQLNEAVDVSSDGRTILGRGVNPDGKDEAWVVNLPKELPYPLNVYIRGTFNNWNKKPMSYRDGVWTTTVRLSANAQFKFDIRGDWSENYGSKGGDAIADKAGPNIVATDGAGEYLITFNYETKVFTVRNTGPGFARVFDQVYFRGTPNNWGTNLMQLVGDNQWRIDAAFAGATTDRFKFDVNGDWTLNYGDTNKDSIAERYGADIYMENFDRMHGAGVYRITFNDLNKAYSVASLSQSSVSLHATDTYSGFKTIETMSRGSDGIWEIVMPFGDAANCGCKPTHPDNFVFSVANSQAPGIYGDSNLDDIAELNGNPIELSYGRYRIRFNDKTNVYSVDSVSSDIKRTVVFIYGRTWPGQDLLLRGGIDREYAKTIGRDCAVDKWLCAIPIQHNLHKTDNNRVNDTYLDWYGAEPGQASSIQGSPLVWTTDAWPAAWGPKKSVAIDGYGEDPENVWGHHYWKLDVMMDCSKTVNGWFELKSYISNGPAWETLSAPQADRPYTGAVNNHFAKCGLLNKFERGSNVALIEPL